MKNINYKTLLLLILTLFMSNEAISWEPFDRVIAVVNDKPIVESDFNRKVKALKRKKGFRNKPKNVVKSMVIDRLINEKLLEETAEKEAIIVSDQKIDNEIKKIMARARISSMANFKKFIENKEKIPFSEYRDQIRRTILMEQIMSYAIVYSPPSKEEAMAWYRKNRKRLMQLKLRHILIIPKNNSFSEQKRVNKLLTKIRNQAVSGKSFAALARRYSQGPSASKGGDLGWMALAEMDPYFAQGVYTMNRPGKISTPIKSSFGYHIVKYYGRRIAPFDEFSNRIYGMLAQQKRMVEFQKWVIRQRQMSDVRVYLKGYKPTTNNGRKGMGRR